MTFIVDGTNGLTFNNSTTQASAGVVLQVVNATSSSATSTTSATFVATTITASITPKFSTSKILAIGQTIVNVGASTNQAAITLYRGATNLVAGVGFGDLYTTTGGYSETILPFSLLDSPATTSSTTYTIYAANIGGAGTIAIGGSTRTAVITLMEIAG
jgi:hypothetical protein